MFDLSDRIQQRLQLVGKSASAVSVEAGLARSALQDIINRRSKNPRLDTLRKLTGPLQCSLSYLTGAPPDSIAQRAEGLLYDIDNEGQNVHRVNVRGMAAANVLRGTGYDESEEYAPSIFIERDKRFPAVDLEAYILGDRSLKEAGLLEDDVLVAIPAAALGGPVRTGSIVIVERILDNAFDSEDHAGRELTAREVQYLDGNLHLNFSSKNKNLKPLIIPLKQIDDFLVGKKIAGLSIQMTAVVVRVIREMPV